MPSTERTVFRLPRTAYLVVLFLLFGALPFALGGDIGSGTNPGIASFGPGLALLLVPIAAAAFIARTATAVDTDGITVRLLFGRRVMTWQQVRGVSVQGSSVYAVLDDGSVRLPCVQLKNLTALSAASGEHLPTLRDPLYKPPPGQRASRR